MKNVDIPVWAGIFGSPIVWLLNLEANFALAPLACADNTKTVLNLVSVVSLALTASAGIVSWTEWHRLHPNPGGPLLSGLSVRCFLALAGMVLSWLFFLVILAQAIPNVLLAGCE